MNIAITGCSRGIGRGLVEYYLMHEPQVKVLAITQNENQLASLKAKYQDRLFSLNSKTALTPGTFPSAFQTVDLLINNAGVYLQDGSGFSELSYDSIDATLKINLGFSLKTTQYFLKALKNSKQPKVIFISSLMGSIEDNTSGGSYSYRISKAALNMLMKCLSIDEPWLTTASLHPGWVKTEMGGPSAPTTIYQSVEGLTKVIQQLTLNKSGQFFDFEGSLLPW